MAQRAQIRVLVVEDHPVVRVGLRTMLESDNGICVAGMASSGKDALAGVARSRPDVILMDLRLPEMDGIQTISALRARDPAAKVIVLTNYHTDEDVFSAFRAGACAYLLKSASQEEIVDAIRAVHAGENRIPAKIAAQLAGTLGRPRISRREHEILGLVARGLTNREIGHWLKISEKTARNHVVSCIEKLGAKDRTELVAIAIRSGLLVVDNV